MTSPQDIRVYTMNQNGIKSRINKGAFINTLVGGGGLGGKMGGQKVSSYQKGGTKKFSLVKGGGQKSLVKFKV